MRAAVGTDFVSKVQAMPPKTCADESSISVPNETTTLRQHVGRYYTTPDCRRCQMCAKNRTTDELIADLDSRAAILVDLPGFVMCNPACVNQYMKEQEDQ